MKNFLHPLVAAALGFVFSTAAFGETQQASQLWATMLSGGANNAGVIYKINADGTNGGVAFTFTDTLGSKPSGNMVEGADNKLYGTASEGGKYKQGVIFSYDVANGTYAKLFDFDAVNGSSPKDLLLLGGKLYGTTRLGGTHNSSTSDLGAGVMYSFNPVTMEYTKLIDFGAPGMNGERPQGLFLANDGKLYGMTRQGGDYGGGTIFSYDPSNGIAEKLYDFSALNGVLPTDGKLMQGDNGILYGVATWGGADSMGTIFSFNIASKTFTHLYSFDGVNGSFPSCTLLQGADGKLYGTTLFGGAYDKGTIFSYDIAYGVYSDLHDFDVSAGAKPFAGVILGSDNLLYGMTTKGGANNTGVIYSFNPSNNSYAVVGDCDGEVAGGQPNSILLEIANSATGINDIASGNVGLYPNPATNILSIQTSNFTPQWTTVFDAKGQAVAQSKFYERLDVTALTAGIYIAELKDAKNNTLRTRFVKQ